MATPETRRQLLAAVAACDDKKGEDTRILELDPADSGLADFFLITSATNDRQVVAIADEIEMRLKKEFGVYPASVEGRRQAEWILLDYVDIVIHVFLQEKRAFYDIERLRKSARPLTSAELEAELKSALAQKTLAVRSSASSPKTPKKTAKVTPGKSPATKATKPKALSAKTSLKGDSNVTAKPAKKAASKAAAKSSFKPSKETKPAVKAPSAKVAAKPPLKSAKKASAQPVGALAPRPVRSSGKSGPANLGAKPPILKCEDPDAPGPVMGVRGEDLGAKPPILKCEDPDTASLVSPAASPATKVAKKAAKKAVKAPIKTPAKAPLKQAIRKRSK
jgi:ribosome-associated protein